MSENHETQSIDLVPPDSACPQCGQRESKALVWLDFERVECQRCSNIFRPGPLDPVDPVPPGDACPKCGQRERDELLWLEDDEHVECQRCKTVYRPGAKDLPAPEDGQAGASSA